MTEKVVEDMADSTRQALFDVYTFFLITRSQHRVLRFGGKSVPLLKRCVAQFTFLQKLPKKKKQTVKNKNKPNECRSTYDSGSGLCGTHCTKISNLKYSEDMGIRTLGICPSPSLLPWGKPSFQWLRR